MSGKLSSSWSITGKDNFLFDLDGTLVDSSTQHESAFRKALAQNHGDVVASFMYETIKGKSTLEALRDLGITGNEELHNLAAAKQMYYRDRVARGEVRLFAGAKELLGFLKRRQKRRYLLSGSSRRTVYSVLRCCGLTECFDGVITADDVKLNKPDPEIYLLGLSKFDLDSERTITIEDSNNGVEASLRAGIDVVVVNNTTSNSHGVCSFSSLEEFYRFAEVQYGEQDGRE